MEYCIAKCISFQIAHKTEPKMYIAHSTDRPPPLWGPPFSLMTSMHHSACDLYDTGFFNRNPRDKTTVFLCVFGIDFSSSPKSYYKELQYTALRNTCFRCRKCVLNTHMEIFDDMRDMSKITVDLWTCLYCPWTYFL